MDWSVPVNSQVAGAQVEPVPEMDGEPLKELVRVKRGLRDNLLQQLASMDPNQSAWGSSSGSKKASKWGKKSDGSERKRRKKPKHGGQSSWGSSSESEKARKWGRRLTDDREPRSRAKGRNKKKKSCIGKDPTCGYDL